MTKSIPVALHHTAFVVRDLEGTAQSLANSLGIGPWHLWTITPAESRMHGRVSPFSFRIALATIGAGEFELVAPHSGRSVLDEQVEKHGAGVHHTCLVYPCLAAVLDADAELQVRSGELVKDAAS